jgi:biotin carboxylase
MTDFDVHDVVLVMRKSYQAHGDHVACLLGLGLRLHIVTEIPDAEVDARFATATIVPPGIPSEQAVDVVTTVARRRGATVAITFQETDIVVAAMANVELSVPWERLDAHRVARDKIFQRRFLRDNGLPSVDFREVRNTDDARRAGHDLGFPCVVKPSRAANSRHVVKVQDEDELLAALAGIGHLAATPAGNYYTDSGGPIALVEAYLPGDEVAVDGLVLDGTFLYAGAHNKQPQHGPYFEEDLYSLPSKIPERESELSALAQAITRCLGLRHALFNVELRQDRDGHFRVVEFSTRISGGLLYRNLHDCYGMDLVRLFAKGLWTDSVAETLRGEVPRLPPRMATCCKGVYVDGVVVRNLAGEAALSPYFSGYIALASPGSRVATAPRGFDLAGVLSVRHPLRGPDDIVNAERVACELHDKLDVVLDPIDG